MEKMIGNYSFIIGVIIAVVLGVASGFLGAAAVWLTSLLVILGLIVGFLNVSGKETQSFLMVVAVLVIVSWAAPGALQLEALPADFNMYLQNIFGHMMAFIVPATVVVALKQVKELAQTPK